MVTFGQRLRKLREEKKLTQKQIGNLLEVSESSIGKYESDQRTPTPDAITKLADYFDVNTDYLLGRTNIRTAITTIAAHRTDDPTKELPEEARKSIEEFKRYIYQKHGIKYD